MIRSNAHLSSYDIEFWMKLSISSFYYKYQDDIIQLDIVLFGWCIDNDIKPFHDPLGMDAIGLTHRRIVAIVKDWMTRAYGEAGYELEVSFQWKALSRHIKTFIYRKLIADGDTESYSGYFQQWERYKEQIIYKTYF